MDDLTHWYQILGLRPGAKLEKVKQDYRDLVKVWHPDRFTHDLRLQNKAQEKLKEINEAYARLCDFYASLQKHARGEETSRYKSGRESATDQRNGQPNWQKYESTWRHSIFPKYAMPFSIRWILTTIAMYILYYWLTSFLLDQFKTYHQLGIEMLDSFKIIAERLS
jgi:curved DNA-binding protein CbpA